MPGSYLWTPPKRNTEDPNLPPLPGMPESKAPRITPHHDQYWNSGNESVWGHLAHPDLREHNPFLNDMDDDYGERGRSWRQDEGGYATKIEDHDPDDDHENAPRGADRTERHLRRTISKALPAIGISAHALHRVLDTGRIKSQFETNSSGGALSPDTRREVEHQFFGYPHDLPDHARPIYGYLTHNPAVQHRAIESYGSHSLILHRPRIWHRTSAYIGDTLDNRYEDHQAHPVQDFKLSGFPGHGDPHNWVLDHPQDVSSYTEAHYHGGVGLRDVHYAVLHKGDPYRSWARPAQGDNDDLKEKFNHHRIPWVEMERGKPVDMEHHLSRLMENASRGAHMHQNSSQVIGQQGPHRYLIDLGYDNENGDRQAQVADTHEGKLYAPASKDSILARGYWDDPDSDVSPEDVLPLVRPE